MSTETSRRTSETDFPFFRNTAIYSVNVLKWVVFCFLFYFLFFVAFLVKTISLSSGRPYCGPPDRSRLTSDELSPNFEGLEKKMRPRVPKLEKLPQRELRSRHSAAVGGFSCPLFVSLQVPDFPVPKRTGERFFTGTQRLLFEGLFFWNGHVAPF